jgi:phage-related protein
LEQDLYKEKKELEKEKSDLEKQIAEIIGKKGNDFFNKFKKEIELEIEIEFKKFAYEKIEKKEKENDIDNIKTDILSLRVLLKYATRNDG